MMALNAWLQTMGFKCQTVERWWLWTPDCEQRALNTKVWRDDGSERLNVNDGSEYLNVDDGSERLNVNNGSERLTVDDSFECVNVNDGSERLTVERWWRL